MENNGYSVAVNNKQHKAMLGLAIFLLIVSLIFGINSIVVGSSKGTYNSEALKDYTEEQFKENYGKDYSPYEVGAILVTFVNYSDGQTFNLKCKKGGKIDTYTNRYFNESTPELGQYLDDAIPSTGYTLQFYQYLGNAMNKINNEVIAKAKATTTKTYGAPTHSKIIDNTKNSAYAYGKATLDSALRTYYNFTGVNISFVIVDAKEIFKPNWGLFALSLIACISFGIYDVIIFKKYKEDAKLYHV